MTWDLRISRRAHKDLRSVPKNDLRRIKAAVDQLGENPYSGDLRWLRGGTDLLRRRVGEWRILFRLDLETETILIQRVPRAN